MGSSGALNVAGSMAEQDQYAKQMQMFNVGEDCPVFSGQFRFCQVRLIHMLYWSVVEVHVQACCMQKCLPRHHTEGTLFSCFEKSAQLHVPYCMAACCTLTGCRF